MRDFGFVHKFSEENQSLISVPKVHIGISISFWLFGSFTNLLENGLLFELVYANILTIRT